MASVDVISSINQIYGLINEIDNLNVNQKILIDNLLFLNLLNINYNQDLKNSLIMLDKKAFKNSNYINEINSKIQKSLDNYFNKETGFFENKSSMIFVKNIFDNNRKNNNIVILGCGGCGKTCIIKRIINNHFFEELDPTIMDDYKISLNVDLNINCELTDCAGQEEAIFSAYKPCKNSDIVLLTISLDNFSLENLRNYYYFNNMLENEIRENKKTLIIILSKYDLFNNKSTINEILIEINKIFLEKNIEISSIIVTSSKIDLNIHLLKKNY